MIIEPNSLAYDLRGVSMYERIAYASIFMMGLLIIKTGRAYYDCPINQEFQGILWEIGFLPLTLLADVTKKYNVSLLVVGLFQTVACSLRLQFVIIYLLYKMLGQNRLIYSLLYILPLVIDEFVPYHKWIYTYVQFILVLLIIMLNKQMMQQKQQKSNYNFRYYFSRLFASIVMIQHLDIIGGQFSNKQLILMLFSIPIIRWSTKCKLPSPIFGVLFLIFYYLPQQYLLIKLILQSILVVYVVFTLLPTIANEKFSSKFQCQSQATVSLLIPIIVQVFPIPEYSFIFLSLLFISEPPQNLYEQIEL